MNLKLLFIGTWDLNQNELVTPGLDVMTMVSVLTTWTEQNVSGVSKLECNTAPHTGLEYELHICLRLVPVSAQYPEASVVVLCRTVSYRRRVNRVWNTDHEQPWTPSRPLPSERSSKSSSPSSEATE